MKERARSFSYHQITFTLCTCNNCTQLSRGMMTLIMFKFVVATVFSLGLFCSQNALFVSAGKNAESTASIIDTCRLRSSDDRLVCLPDVMFIGASKAGTSSIAAYLFQHPMIENARVMSLKNNPHGGFHEPNSSMPSVHRKESHYWDGSNPKGVGILKTIYDQQPGFKLQFNQSRPLVMDYTPNYLVTESAAKLISEKMSNAAKLKFIVILRDPTQRTISSWVYKKSCKSCQDTAPRMPSFKTSVDEGIDQGNCVYKCFNKQIKKFNYKIVTSDYNTTIFTNEDGNGCSISRCRIKYDSTGGKTGGSPFMV